MVAMEQLSTPVDSTMTTDTSTDCWSVISPSHIEFPFSWVGHIPFAMWLVCVLRPRTFVELGTHSGNSYLAVCESIKHHGLPTRCYAVDTWGGDEHAGHYSNDVYETLKHHHDPHFGSFSTLLRMTFDDALAHISDNSVDLLHIDGLHTYEAVKHDFDTWHPKLTPNAVVLFHDTAVQGRDFGVHRFWTELQQQHTHTITFEHSNGLGVLFLAPPDAPEVLGMLDCNNQQATADSELKARFQTLGNQLIFHSALNSVAEPLAAYESQRATLAQMYDTQVHHFNLQQSSQAQLNHAHHQHLADVERGYQHMVGLQKTMVAHLEHARQQQYNALQTDLLRVQLTLQHELNLQRQHIANLEHTIVSMRASRSWRMTAPVRTASTVIRQLPGVSSVLKLRRQAKALIGSVRRHGLAATAHKVQTVVSQQGLSGLLGEVQHSAGAPLRIEYNNSQYQHWIRTREAADHPTDPLALINAMASQPAFSVLMPVYNPPLNLLKQAVESVRTQSYPHWELCIADDASPDPQVKKYLQQLAAAEPRVKLVLRPVNGHISASSNSALEVATGDFVVLLDHDDLLARHALLEVAITINKHPQAAIVYSDEDKIDVDGHRHDPYFKSDWNLEIFLSQNMVSHLGVYRTALLNEIGGFRLGYEGSQDYDLALRCILKLQHSQVVHIPKVLYHWRVLPGSTSASLAEKPYAQVAGQNALNAFLTASGLGGHAECLAHGGYRIYAPLPEPAPLASIIIPTRNAAKLVRTCIDSVLQKTTYAHYEIILVDNGSDEPEALAYFEQLNRHPIVRVLRDDRPFNYSALNNAAVQQAKGTVVVLMNNDIEVITPTWLDEMVALALRPGVGAVGAKLWYPDHHLQHGGVIIGLGGVAGHSHHRMKWGQAGYFGRAAITQGFSAVTAACLVTTKAAYEWVGGLNETDLTVAFNDVDFCLRLLEAGYRNVWTPYAELYHHESVSRGQDDTPEKQARFNQETEYMRQRWASLIANDPCYNPNLSLVSAQQFQLRNS